MTPPVHKERVLSTLNADGTRRWIRPKLAHGRFLRRRRIVGYALIALFVALPFVKIGGRPAFQIDLVARELSAFGAVFRPSDGVILMLLGLSVVSTVFLVTALFGRVWCGWGCPQTVYLELVFRPIERLLEGTPSQQEKLPRFHPRRVAKWGIYLVIAFALANVFLAYFVGVDQLKVWVLDSPLDHLGGFLVVMGVWALMMFDFAYFREQACIVACPYGRLQSVLLDRQSLIVAYDTARGEPRGKAKKKLPVVSEAKPLGDCVDCSACVTVCPTGIDIRNGLQMECVGCAQCIDACDSVMDKLGRKRGLIGYTSQEVLAGHKKKLLRPRTVIYPLLLVLAGSLFAYQIGNKAGAEVWVERVSGPSFFELPDGTVASQARIKIENTSDDALEYTVAFVEADLALRSQATWRIEPRASKEIPVIVDVPRATFVDGKRKVQLEIVGYEKDHDKVEEEFRHTVTLTLLGPVGGTR